MFQIAHVPLERKKRSSSKKRDPGAPKVGCSPRVPPFEGTEAFNLFVSPREVSPHKKFLTHISTSHQGEEWGRMEVGSLIVS